MSKSDKKSEALRILKLDAGKVAGKSLRGLRGLAGLTQAQMAKRLGVGQASISKIESRGDIHLSSLQKYLEVLGAGLRIDAIFPTSVLRSDAIRAELEESGAGDVEQLSFPIFEGAASRLPRDLVLSIRPHYSEKILEGEKTIELRRRFPVAASCGATAYIYSSSPTRAIVGRVEIADVIKLPVSEIWKQYGKSASIAKPEFEEYFKGLKEGFALKLRNVEPIPRPMSLSELREKFDFEPPQSFLYAKPVLQSALQNEYSNVSN